MLNSIKLTNFKKHKNLEVDFTRGLNVIKGPNFCGKSTLLKAVAVALYGITGAGAKSRICTTGETKWKIELVIKVDGKDYTVVRSGSASKVLHKDEVVANGNSVVTAWVADNTGSDLDDFLTHTYSKQMETSTLLTMGTAKLQNKVEKLANVEIVDKVLKLIREKTSETKGKLELISEQDLGAIEQQYQELKGKKEQAETEHTAAYDSLNSLRSTLEKLEGEHQLNLDNLADIQTCELLLTGYEDSKKSVEQAIEDNGIELRKISDTVEADHKRVYAEVKFMEETLLHKVDEVNRKTRLDETVQKIKIWMEKAEPMLKDELRLDPIIEKMELEIEQSCKLLTQKLETKNKSSVELKSLMSLKNDAVCPTCLRPNEGADLDEIKNKVSQKTKSHAAVCETYEEVKQETEILKIELESLLQEYPGEGHAKLIEEQKETMSTIEQQLETMQELPSKDELDDMRKELEPKRAEQKALQGLLDLADRLTSDIISAKKIVAENSQLMEDEVSKITEMKTNPHSPEKLEAGLSEANSKMNVESENFYLLEKLVQVVNIDFAVIESQYNSAKDSDKKAKELNKSLGLLTRLSKYLRTSRSRFLSTVWDGILSRATEIVSGATAGNEDQITQVGRDKKGAFFYVEKGEEFGMTDASGCQMEFMGVALRLALCDLFYGYGSYMMLDEASSQMNEENAAALAGVLAATGKQIIYVTHRETEETSAKNVITIGEE